MQKSEKQIAMRVSVITIIINLLLSIFKLWVGLLMGSDALISDSIHSASDVFSTLIVIFGIIVSSKAPDEQHQYGHERIESIVSLILAGILFIIGVGIGYNGIINIIHSTYQTSAKLAWYGVLAAVSSIIVKEGMYRYTKNAAIKVKSDSLMADAWHHRSDAISSIGSLIGVIGVRLGYPILDSIASIIICVFIIKVSAKIFMDACSKLIDKSCDKNTLKKIESIALNQNGVLRIDMIKTRMFGAKLYIDIEISVEASQPLSQAHLISEHVHKAVEENIEQTKHCMVHVNPF